MTENAKKTFAERIAAMNAMYRLPMHHYPTLPKNPAERLAKFKKTIGDEVQEIDDIIELNNNPHSESGRAHIASAFGLDVNNPEDAARIESCCNDPALVKLALATAVADVLGDIIVYCRSEALKYGIPLEGVLDVIMDSNESKLDENGNPIYNAEGKFLKGPGYWKPEPKIAEMLSDCGVTQLGDDQNHW